VLKQELRKIYSAVKLFYLIVLISLLIVDFFVISIGFKVIIILISIHLIAAFTEIFLDKRNKKKQLETQSQ